MSLAGIMESRVSVWRLSDGVGSSNRLGEPSKVPIRVQTNLRGSIDSPRMMMSHDAGPGNQSTGNTVLVVERRADILLNDIISIDSGSNAGTWWTVNGFVREPQRGQHKEGFVSPYSGNVPTP